MVYKDLNMLNFVKLMYPDTDTVDEIASTVALRASFTLFSLRDNQSKIMYVNIL